MRMRSFSQRVALPRIRRPWTWTQLSRQRATPGRPGPVPALCSKGKLLERPIDITPTEPGKSTETEVG